MIQSTPSLSLEVIFLKSYLPGLFYEDIQHFVFLYFKSSTSSKIITPFLRELPLVVASSVIVEYRLILIIFAFFASGHSR